MPSINLVVQALTLLTGLLVNFLFPALFGLEAYGELLRLLLGTFVVHRLVDTMAEPLIAICTERSILATALLTNAASGSALALLAVASGTAHIDLPVLGAMVGTSTALLTLHRNRRPAMVALNLATFAVVMVLLSLMHRYAVVPLDLRDILLATNAAGLAVGSLQVALVYRDLARGQNGSMAPEPGLWRIAPLALASTLVSSFLTTIFVFLVSGALAARELATFRVFTSIVQASAAVFPVNLKAIFVAFGESDARARMERILRTSFWLMAILSACAVAVSAWRTEWAPVAAAACVSVPYFWSLCLERYVQMRGNRVAFRALNVGLFVVLILLASTVTSLETAVTFYAAAAAVYCAALALIATEQPLRTRLIVIAAACAAGAGLGASAAVPAFSIPASIALLGLVALPPGRSLVPTLLGRL